MRTRVCLGLSLCLAACAADDVSSIDSELTDSADGDHYGVVTGGIYQDIDTLYSLESFADQTYSEVANGITAGWIRIDATWPGTDQQPMPARLLGRIVEKAHEHSLKVVVVISPDTFDGTVSTETNIARYLDRKIRPRFDPTNMRAAFTTNLAKPDVVEVGNELGGLDRWGGDATARLARAVKDVLGDATHASRFAQVQVSSAGIANTWGIRSQKSESDSPEISWVSDFLSSRAWCHNNQPPGGGCDYRVAPFDFVAVHPYNSVEVDAGCVTNHGYSCWDVWRDNVRRDLQDFRTRMNAASGTTSMQLLITEFGWQHPSQGWGRPCDANQHNCVQFTDQMPVAIGASNLAFRDSGRNWLVRAALWYDYMDDAEHFGLRYSNHTHKGEAWQKLREVAGGPAIDEDLWWHGTRFLDLPVDNWANEYVDPLAGDFVIDGRSDGNFSGGADVTRGEFSAYLVRGLTHNDGAGRPYCNQTLFDPTYARFRDVGTTHRYFQYIETLVARGVISGYDDLDHCGSYSNIPCFQPDSPLLRGQAAKMFALANGWAWESNPPWYCQFSDVPPDNLYYGYVGAVCTRGVMTGYAGGSFGVWSHLTRSQIAKMLKVTFDRADACQ